ncbi:MAG TPA: hypothetical protein VHY91_23605 [Pirellulales bacterium]|nr:hypothetical protein [Pirellulales bacterium]
MVVLTPAEELGLSGLSLDSRVRKAFYGLPPATIVDLWERMNTEARVQNLVYFHEGRPETIRIMLRPIGVMPDQLAYLNYVSLSIINALKRLPDMYLEDPRVRAIVPLSPVEEQWLADGWGPSHRELNPVLGRLDAVVEFTSPMWKDSLRFMEPNLCGVGGIHLGPAAEQLLASIVLPVLQAQDPGLEMEVGQDFREIFIQEVLDHLQALGRAGQNVCFVEPKYSGQGTDEQEVLAEYYRRRHGLTIVHADPAELTIEGEEVYYDGCRVDIAYRDYEVRDLAELQRTAGVNLDPVRLLFRQNRMISSLAGDFDHKSCWEVLTDHALTQKYFTAEERQVFRRHILWTRLLFDRDTTLPDGDSGSLVPFVRTHQEMLVLKPNRSYGGDRVVIGPAVDSTEWEAEVDRALADPQAWVVQRVASLPVHEFPVVDDEGEVHIEPFYTVMGFAPSKYGLAIIGRASQKQVVNVAQRGGMCGILVGRPPARLVGPASKRR